MMVILSHCFDGGTYSCDIESGRTAIASESDASAIMESLYMVSPLNSTIFKTRTEEGYQIRVYHKDTVKDGPADWFIDLLIQKNCGHLDVFRLLEPFD